MKGERKLVSMLSLRSHVHGDGQGIEFNRSFRKLSGSVISDRRPGKQRQCE